MFNELKYWYLREHKLFEKLNSAQIKQLCIISGFKTAKKGEIIYFSNSDVPRIFLLKKGNIKIVEVDNSGNESIKDIIQTGDLFGEITFEADKNSSEFAKALTEEVSICSFKVSDFENVMVQNPSLAIGFTKFVGLKLKRVKNNYANLISKDAKSRLLTFLNDWIEREGKFENEKVTLVNYLTQNDIAQIICTSRQTATILLNELEEIGIIQYNRKEIIFPNYSLFKKTLSL